jgi:hypothetical protein
LAKRCGRSVRLVAGEIASDSASETVAATSAEEAASV